MSGGHFDYAQHYISDIASEIERLIETNDSTEKDSWGGDLGRHFDHDIIERFKYAVSVMNRAQEMAHRIDWLASGDDGPDSFRKRWDEKLGE
jgi:hypothetical protein